MALANATLATRALTAGPISFERTLIKLERMVADPDCSPGLVASVLTSDPMLTALILSRVNAAPGEREPIISLPTAVGILGLSTIQGLLAEVTKVTDEQRNLVAAHWSLGLATGTMAKVIARVTPRRHPGMEDDDIIHTCGLCHDLGNTIAHLAFPRAWSEASQLVDHDPGGPGRAPVCMSAALRHTLGMHGGTLAALLARGWCLPPTLTACMRFYGRPSKAPEGLQPLVATIHIARELVRGCGFTIPGEPFVEIISSDAIDILGLRTADFEIAIRGFDQEWEELELFEAALGQA